MESHFLQELVVMFCLSMAVVLVCHRFRLPSIVGFLITGALCGPSALGLVTSIEVVDLMAEVGVVFLLFTIGMEMSGKELARLKRPVFIGGTSQVLLTVFGIALCCWQLGYAKGIVYGCLVALSSTAIVLSLIQQKAQAESPQGRVCLAILIFQDIAIVPMMLLIPLLAGDLDTDAGHVLGALTRSALVLGGIYLLGKYVLPRLMLSVVRTRSRELMLMTTLGLCLAVALVTSSLGLSLALGAFLAGLLLAESEYSLSVLENVLPFKDVFTSIFFISIGMLLDMAFFIEHIGIISLIAVTIIGAKIILTLPAVLAVGYSMRTAIIAAFSLAQIGEFSFVLARTGVDVGLLDNNSYQIFLAASILTMTLTPSLMAAGVKAGSLVRRQGKRLAPMESQQEEDSLHSKLKDHLIIIGFGIGGKNLARVARESGIPYIISEMNPDTVAQFRNAEPIFHGDASFPLVLQHLRADKARVLAILVSDPVGSRAIIAHARRMNPALHIVVRSRFVGEVAPLCQLGADDVVPEELEASVEVFARVLNHYLVPRQSINQYVDRIRSENYGVLRQMDLPDMSLADLNYTLPDLHVAAYTVEEQSPIAGQSLAESRLRNRYNVTLAGLRRGQITHTQFNAETQLLPGDIAYLFASQTALNAAAILFQAPGKREAENADNEDDDALMDMSAG